MILKISGQRLDVDCDVIAEGAIDFVTLEVQCDEGWRDFCKTVRFERDGELYDLRVEEGKSYYLPPVILTEGKVGVGVIGVADGSRVATTEKTYFYVRGGVASGKTPITAPDVYAQYVNEVEEHRRSAERSEQVTAMCLEKCETIGADTNRLAREVANKLCRCEEILREVSGILDAVGMAFCDINGIKESLTSSDSRYSLSENERQRSEHTRDIVEKKRELSEEERRQREVEREAGENRRKVAEEVRALSEVRRNERIKELEERLSAIEEERSTSSVSVITGKGEITLDDGAEVESITFYGDGLCGDVTFVLGDTAYEIPIYSPLLCVGDIADSVTVSGHGEVTLCRRTATVTLNGSESYDFDPQLGAFITPLTSETPLFDVRETVTSFKDGSIEINGDYIFIYPDGDYTIPTFAEVLKKTPIEMIYPILRPKEEAVCSLQLEGLPHRICYGGNIIVAYQRDAFKELDAMNERIKKIEKEKNNENTQKIHVTQILGRNGGRHRPHIGAVKNARKRDNHSGCTYHRLRNAHRIHLRRNVGRRGKRGKGRYGCCSVMP